jgi:hypothetical protein
MNRRFPQPVASVAAFLWILAQGLPVATAFHVAEDHAHHGHAHAAAAAGTASVHHGHGHHDDGHFHGLPEAVPGVRSDVRVVPAVPAHGLGGALAPPEAPQGSGAPTARAPAPPPPQAPTVLRL